MSGSRLRSDKRITLFRVRAYDQISSRFQLIAHKSKMQHECILGYRKVSPTTHGTWMVLAVVSNDKQEVGYLTSFDHRK